MNAETLDELLEYFNKKIASIHELIPLLKLCDWTPDCSDRVLTLGHNLRSAAETNGSGEAVVPKPDLPIFTDMIFEMRSMIDEMKVLLLKEKEQLQVDTETAERQIANLKKHVQYLKSNIPPFMKRKETTATNGHSAVPNQTAVNGNARNNLRSKTTTITSAVSKPKPVPSARKPSGQALKPRNAANNANRGANNNSNTLPIRKKVDEAYKNPASIVFVTTDEFDTIPGYMRGRLNYDAINRAIGDINRTIVTKYKLMYSNQTKMSDEEFKRFQTYKSQENAETKGEFFCTMNDIKELSDYLKADNTTKTILTCLRHCKRIKEIRGPAKLIRYAVVKDIVPQTSETE